MKFNVAILFATVLFAGSANLVRAEDAKKEEPKKAKKEERFYSRGPEIDKLKSELALTDDQIAKIKSAIAAVDKKNEEMNALADVKAAEEAVKKAKDALKAAAAPPSR